MSSVADVVENNGKYSWIFQKAHRRQSVQQAQALTKKISFVYW